MVYATDRRGSVLARKLIAVAPPNRLLGYRTYAFADQIEHKRQLDQICAEFAETSGLTLSQVGTPEAIVGESLWYDDGTEPWLVSAGTADAGRRELISDDEIEDGDYGLDADLIHGLWLDGRLSASQRAAAVARETRQCGCGGAVGSVPLFDPTGFAEAARRYTGPPGSMDGVELRPDRALIEAATRIASAVDGGAIATAPARAGADVLARVDSRQPSDLLLETLRVRGASLRRLRTVAVASTHRCFAEFGDFGQRRQAQAAALAHVRLRLASEQQLRRMLEAPTTASSAAYELVCRGSGAHAEAIGVASARAPWNETLALTAAAMRVGSPWDPRAASRRGGPGSRRAGGRGGRRSRASRAPHRRLQTDPLRPQ